MLNKESDVLRGNSAFRIRAAKLFFLIDNVKHKATNNNTKNAAVGLHTGTKQPSFCSLQCESRLEKTSNIVLFI